jgi:uncharacterized protein (DUF1778 family)
MPTAVREKDRRDLVVNMRLSRQQRDLIDDAADAVGKSRSEFILESAREHAIDVLMDRRLFVLDERQFAEFIRVLDRPPKPSKRLRQLFKSKSPWEK